METREELDFDFIINDVVGKTDMPKIDKDKIFDRLWREIDTIQDSVERKGFFEKYYRVDSGRLLFNPWVDNGRIRYFCEFIPKKG